MDKLNSSLTNISDIFRNNSINRVAEENKSLNKQKPYVTELNAHHHPERDQNKHINEMICLVKNTDSIRERNSLVGEIKSSMREMTNDLHILRNKTFIVKKADTVDADDDLGILAKNHTSNDRDNYIKSLSNYHDIITQLGEGLGNDDMYKRSCSRFSIEQDLAMQALGYDEVPGPSTSLHHSGSLYGDLCALSDLESGEPAEVPDFRYNNSRSGDVT